MYDSKLYWTLSYLGFCSYECISISAFASLLRKTTSSTIGLKICATAKGIKKHKSIIKKMKKKHDEIALLAKTKLNSI